MNAEEIKVRHQAVFSLRALGLLAAGALWFVLALIWVPFFWIGLLHNLCLIALVLVDRRELRAIDQIVIAREFDEPLSLGTPNLVSVIITNKSAIPLQVKIRDEPPQELRAESHNLSTLVVPGKICTLGYHMTPTKRGQYAFGRLNARFSTPLGLLVLQRSDSLGREARVYPNILETKKHQLLAQRRQLTQMGLRVSRLRGMGLEFESLREYVPDDELRKVDWKATARRRTLVTREYNFERSRNLVLMLDCGRLMTAREGELTKLDHAVNAAMLLSYVGVRHDDRVGLVTFSGDVIEFLPPGKGRAQIDAVMKRLYHIQPEPIEPNYRRAMLFTAHHIKKRSLIVLFTDLMDPDSSGRLIEHIHVLGRKHLVLCVALREQEWDRLLFDPPSTEADLYQQAVAISVLEDRRRALGQLAATGVLTLDATAQELSVATVNRYLKIKQEARL